MPHCTISLVFCLALSVATAAQQDPPGDRRVRVLFLGDRGSHRPAERAQQIVPVLARRGIDAFYTDRLGDLSADNLRLFDALLIYANHPRITPAQERALLDFVASGRGLVAVHCASYCFHNSPAYIALVGAQFRRHGTGTFRAKRILPDHPVTAGLTPIESWDETYVHHRHNQDRTVLSVREENDTREPWTWVRNHENGRVFYTAWGHDQRTWSNTDFHDLLERGIRWACGDWALTANAGRAPFTRSPAKVPVPNYVTGKQRDEQQHLADMQDPLSPSDSREHYTVAPEFEISLFAAEPDIRKPIAMAWDERGRLWIAETTDYPNDLQPEGEGRDRILICEDTDRDDRADRFTVFADRLSIPTSLTFAAGGVIVSQAPHTLFLRDTDGDDRADERRVLFTGWRAGDTHAGPSNLRYGFDNWIWGAVGYDGFSGEIGGRAHAFGQGYYRFRPDGSALEFLGSTTNNTWGLGFSEEGHVFGSTANGNPSVHLAIANRHYESVHGWSSGALQTIAETTVFHPITEHVRQVDFHGKFTAAAGHALYTARSFPRRYWNRVAFVNGPTGHLLHRFELEPDGTHFVARDAWNLAASDDEWSAPISAEIGPDGAVWFIDWYNYIVQHNPTPHGFQTGKGNAYVTPLRDKRHGRIYRVRPRGAQRGEPRDLRDATPERLVATLRDDNLFWRLTAQRLIVEHRAPTALEHLLDVLARPQLDALGLDPGALHAIWALHGLDLIATDATVRVAVEDALTHPAVAVRRAALQALPRDERTRELILDGGCLADDAPHVRLAALLALSEMPRSERAGRAVFARTRIAAELADRWLPDAITAAAARHDAGFLQAALAAAQPPSQPGAQPAPRPAAPVNALPNPSFEELAADRPAGWTERTYGGRAEHAHAPRARSGTHSLQISSTRGADSSWFASVPVEPDTTYRLSGWIKTDQVVAKGGAHGALFNVHEIQGPEPARTRGLTGTHDWTQVAVVFETGSRERVSINCLFGGWGFATGTAWFDDVRLERVAGDSVLPGKAGRIVMRVAGHFAARAPRDSVVATLLALRNAPQTFTRSLLDGLLDGWPEGEAPTLTGSDRAALGAFLRAQPSSVRVQLVALADRWGQREIFTDDLPAVLDDLRQAVADPANATDERSVAATRLIGLDDSPETIRDVLRPITVATDPALADALLTALTASRAAPTAGVLLEHWPHLTPARQRVAIDTLTRRPPWTRALLTQVVQRRIDPTALNAQTWLQLSQHPDAAIAALAERARGNASDDDRAKIVADLMPVAQRRGDAGRGADVFATQCAACHAFAGKGGAIGPPLDGIGARPRADVLIAILDPNRSVEANYRLWTIATENGQVFAGRLAAESRTTFELVDLAGTKHVIDRADVESATPSPVSLMPAAFEHLGADALSDLLEYLYQ